jgi:hypothetical protein
MDRWLRGIGILAVHSLVLHSRLQMCTCVASADNHAPEGPVVSINAGMPGCYGARR